MIQRQEFIKEAIFAHARRAAVIGRMRKMVAITNPLPATHGEFGFPRRACLDANHKAEIAIRAAMCEVETLGADPLLTNAVTKLGEAKELIADWLEGKAG